METFVIQTRSGEVTFQSDLTDEAAVSIMLSVKKPTDFAYDLARAYVAGKYSPKQRAWIHKLANDAAIPKTQQAEKVDLGVDFSKIAALFIHASKIGKLKYPAIHLEVNGNSLKLHLAGPQSKHCGSIQVTDGGGYGNGKYYGRIDSKDGKYQPGQLAPQWVADFLKEFAVDPAKVAHEYGARTGRCCFCNSVLTERSADAGFGDTCARSYGLFEEWKFYTNNGRGAGKKPVNINENAVPVNAGLSKWVRR